MYLLSANGTLRTILILLIAWQLLRYWIRSQQVKRPSASHDVRWTTKEQRPKGELRIEQVEEVTHDVMPLDVEDAEFEVIKEKPTEE